MKTNEKHIAKAIHVFAPGKMDDIDYKQKVLRLLSDTSGKGPLKKSELADEYDASWWAVVQIHLVDLIEEGLVEIRSINGQDTYALTKYFEDLIYWQRVKAGLIEHPAK